MPRVATRLGHWFYEEHGSAEGRPIVLLHGLYFDGRSWEAQVPALAKLGRVLVLDGPGHGRSELPPPFTLEDHADALAEALGALGVREAFVAGHSWGAMVALRFALAHPGRTAGLALLGGSADVESRSDVLAHRVAIEVARRVPLSATLARAVLLPMILSEATRRERPELVDEIVRTMQSQASEGVARASLAVVGRARRLKLALSSVRAPTLVLCGEDDRATPPTLSRDLAEGIAGAELSMIARAGHLSLLEQPGLVSDALAGFVASRASLVNVSM